MSRILILNQTFYPDVVATAQHLGDLAFHLAKQGHSVEVITSCRAYATPDKVFPSHEVVRGVTIHRVITTAMGKGAKWRRAIDFASFLVSAAGALIRRTLFGGPRPDLVIALTTPPLVSVLGAYAARWWGARFVYWIMDLNPDEAVAAGWLRSDSFLTRCLEGLSRWSLLSADRIIALDQAMQEKILAKGIRPDVLRVISPWSHDSEVGFDPSGRDAFRQEHGWSDKFVVMYSGNHSPCHPLDTVLDAAARLRDDARFHFAFVGGGTGLKTVRAAQEDHHLSNVQILPYQPMEKLSASLSSADAQVVVMGTPFVGLIHPCKIYNALMVGAPIISVGPAQSHVTTAIAACGRGDVSIAVDHGEGAQLAAALLALAEKRNHAHFRQPITGGEAPFSEGRLLHAWDQALASLATA